MPWGVIKLVLNLLAFCMHGFQQTFRGSVGCTTADPKKKILLIQGQGRRWYKFVFFRKSFELLYVKKHQFNAYRKFRRVSSIVSRMVYYLAAILLISFMKLQIKSSTSEWRTSCSKNVGVSNTRVIAYKTYARQRYKYAYLFQIVRQNWSWPLLVNESLI